MHAPATRRHYRIIGPVSCVCVLSVCLHVASCRRRAQLVLMQCSTDVLEQKAAAQLGDTGKSMLLCRNAQPGQECVTFIVTGPVQDTARVHVYDS
jgi:hypothetical protein